nr:MAG TPA_asm: hypothetical protein [Caudoviricetes sp.]
MDGMGGRRLWLRLEIICQVYIISVHISEIITFIMCCGWVWFMVIQMI